MLDPQISHQSPPTDPLHSATILKAWELIQIGLVGVRLVKDKKFGGHKGQNMGPWLSCTHPLLFFPSFGVFSPGHAWIFTPVSVPSRICWFILKKLQFPATLLSTHNSTSKRHVLLNFFWCNILSSGIESWWNFDQRILGEEATKDTRLRPTLPLSMDIERKYPNFIKIVKIRRGTPN